MLIARSILLLCSLILFSVSCSQQETECPIFIDQVSIIDHQDFDSTNYYLVERISGWHKKSTIIELFDRKPTFDYCNENLIPPIIDELVSTELEVKSFSINLKTRQYKIDYGDPSESIMQTSKFKIKFE